jgi:ketosteroid isomerase-like protein
VARAKAKKAKSAKRGGRAKPRTARARQGRNVARGGAKRPAKRAANKARSGSGARTDAMRAFAQRIIDVTIADNDDEILALYADDIESTEAGQPPMVGHDALRSKFAGWRGMVTDTSFEPRRVVVDGNVIVIEWVGRVTLAASGRQAELHEVAVHEIRDGKIAREAFFYNPAALA